MQISSKTEHSFRIVEERIKLNSLKITGNERYLWVSEGKVEDYEVKMRVAFKELSEIDETIQTGHVCVRKTGEDQVDIEILVEESDFEQSGERPKNKIIEKERGMNCKCIICKRALDEE